MMICYQHLRLEVANMATHPAYQHMKAHMDAINTEKVQWAQSQQIQRLEVANMATTKPRITTTDEAAQRLRDLGYHVTSGIDQSGMEYWMVTQVEALNALPRMPCREELIEWANCLS